MADYAIKIHGMKTQHCTVPYRYHRTTECSRIMLLVLVLKRTYTSTAVIPSYQGVIVVLVPVRIQLCCVRQWWCTGACLTTLPVLYRTVLYPTRTARYIWNPRDAGPRARGGPHTGILVLVLVLRPAASLCNCSLLFYSTVWYRTRTLER